MRATTLLIVLLASILIVVLLSALWCKERYKTGSAESFALARHHGDGPGSRFRCEEEGCEETPAGEEGEFLDISRCKRSCRSWVRRDGECVEVEGFPWDAYATQEACVKKFYDSYS